MTPDGSHPIESLRNLGPKTANRLRELGIQNAEELKKVGAVKAFQLLKANFPDSTNTIALMALAGALLDEDWRKVPKEIIDSMKREVWEEQKKFRQ